MLHSRDLALFESTLPKPIQEALLEIQQFFGIAGLKVLSFDEFNIVIPVEYKVPIPPRGAVGGIDIRPIEPVLIKLSLNNYPNQSPIILSDRKDFPKRLLPHLYVSTEDSPARFCLVRNDPNEWFASKNLSDLLTVAHQWLFKAAVGILVDDGEEFDPTRLEGFIGSHIYKYDVLNEIVEKDQRFLLDHGMAILLGYCDEVNSGSLTLKTISNVPFIQAHDILSAIKVAIQKGNSESERAFPVFSLLVWDPSNSVDDIYSTWFPENYRELRVYFQLKGIDIDQIIDFYERGGFRLRIGIPIIHALRRPKKIIGYNGSVEFFNFFLTPKKGGTIEDDAKVLVARHLEPFSKQLAIRLSGSNRGVKSMYIGAGSLGSKMILHDARAGKTNIGVVDHDSFMPHNIARHGLFENCVGKNKAEGIVEQIKQSYFLDNLIDSLVAYPCNIISVSPNTFKKYDWLVDTSASLLVQNYLTKLNLPSEIVVSRAEVADDGTIGLLYIEGRVRNPRIDDLVNYTYFLALQNTDLRAWRMRDAKREPDTVDIGLGCSSTTTIMADDVIAFHASVFSRLLANEIGRKNIGKKGLIYISVNEQAGLPSLRSTSYLVEPFESVQCKRKSGWEIRMKNGLSEELLDLCAANAPIETGGALVGIANYKTKTIHVFEIISEPKDSKGAWASFIRGVDGLPASIDGVKEKTGQVVGYVGEWHTHPMGLERLSSIDEATVEQLKAHNRKRPIPTLALVITLDKILPFVYE